MQYTSAEVVQFVQEEDVKFIRLAFCDVYGKQKNISIMPTELKRAFEYGIAIDGSAIAGFDHGSHSDLILHPDPNTLAILPWRPEHGRVIRMFCAVTYPDGSVFENDTRSILAKACKDAEEKGYHFSFGSEMEFYLFKLDEDGNPTNIPYDQASYMDIAPIDKGENVRREICLTLEQMGIQPESSHHEEGPGQNEIDFRFSNPLSAADHAITFRNVVQTVAARNGLIADFSPKPLQDLPGNGFHINISAKKEHSQTDLLPSLLAGIMKNMKDMTVFFNTAEKSYERLGNNKAPRYISWSKENRSQLIRIPAAKDQYVRAELRSPDPLANPYIVFSLLIYAAMEGMDKQIEPPKAVDIDLFRASAEETKDLQLLPLNLTEAKRIAKESAFIKAHLPEELIHVYCN